MAQVTFKARGKRVSFWSRPRRKGPVPKHLKRYLFKPHKASGRKRSRR
jgi:hypothetical protein